jgi:hypothetical protein
MGKSASRTEFRRRFGIAEQTAKWAVIMAKVCIRQAVAQRAWPRWHLIDFCGKEGRESRGVVDVIAIRKDHSEHNVRSGLKRGDALQIVLIQVKGGSSAKPNTEDAQRLRIVARRHNACALLLGTWKKGKSVQFYSLKSKTEWTEVTDLTTVFC